MIKRSLFYVMSLIMIGLLFFNDPSMALSNDFVIIANHSAPVDTLPLSKLRQIFTGVEVVWQDSSEIIVATLSPCDTHTSFTINITEKTPAQFKATWGRLLYLGQVSRPETFNTDQEMIEFVAKTKGAIGYVSSMPQDDRIKLIKIAE